MDEGIERCQREMTLEEKCHAGGKATLEEKCQAGRVKIEDLKSYVCIIFHSRELDEDAPLKGNNIPISKNANIKANLTLAFRHLEDARMRLGKAIQAYSGGISILGKK